MNALTHASRILVAILAICGLQRLHAQEYPRTETPASAQFAIEPGTAAPSLPALGPPGQLFEPAEVLAVVGDQFILAGDVMPHVNQILEQYRGKVPESVINDQRRMVTAQITRSHIEAKLLYLQFLRKIPADKVAGIHKKIHTKFDDDLEETRKRIDTVSEKDYGDIIKKDPQIGRLAIMMKEKGVWSQRELDALLRSYGGSVGQERDYYAEYQLGRMILSQNINFKPEISLDEMLKYFEDQAAKYQVPERAKFEILTARFDKFRTKEEAYDAICRMGNEVFYGASLAAVAKRSSQGLNADKGGAIDWTPRNSLASKPLNEALFTLEVGKLSQVIEDNLGYHIVRVLEREQEGKVPFATVQKDIEESIRREKINKSYTTYVESLRKGTIVTTAFDEEPKLRVLARGQEDTVKR